MMDENKEKKEEIEEVEEDVVAFEFNEDGEEDLKATLKKFRKDLKVCKTEKAEYLTNWQKERADFQNYKKDEVARSKQTAEYVREKFIEELLPVLDAYDMAFSNKEAWEKVDKNWRIGVEYIHQQLLRVLADYNVTPITPATSDVFDPNLHESIDTVSTDDESLNHKIAALVQSGYKSNDRVIRAARVKVFEKTDK